MSIINWTETNPSIRNSGPFVKQPQLSRPIPSWWLDTFDKNKLVLGLKGHYYAEHSRLEINRIDGMTNEKYTQWEEWDTYNGRGVGWPISPENDRSQSEKGKGVEVDLEEVVDISFQDEGFDKQFYIEAVIDYLNFKLSKQDFKIEGWKVSDFDFIEAEFVENTFTVAAGDDSVSHSYSGDGEIMELYWTVDTDMQNWTIVHIGENND
jgi:hypothetical protein